MGNSRREISAEIVQHISDGYAVVYVGDEKEDTLIQDFLDKSQEHIKDYQQKGLLTVVNRDVFYSPFVPPQIILDQWSKIFSTIEKKAGKASFKGFVAMGMPADSFFISELDNHQLVQYEALAAKKYYGELEAVCMYTIEMLQKMPLRYVISLLNAHQNTGHKGGILKEWDTKRALSIIRRALDSAFTHHVAGLILQTILRDFEMKEESIVLHPDQFERKMTILLGTSVANTIFECIKNEINRDVAY